MQPVPLDDVVGSRARGSRSDLIDVGVQQGTGGLTLGIDGYARFDRDAIGLRYRTDAPFADAFSYAHVQGFGAELAITYAQGPFAAWSNVALAHATGSGLRAGEAALTLAQLTYGASHRITLDTDQRLTGSAGASLRLGELRVAGDLVAGSGTPRTAPGGAQNGARNPSYVLINAAVVLRIDLVEKLPTDLRFDIRNLFDRRVALNDGSALRAGAPACTAPRGLFVGLEQAF